MENQHRKIKGYRELTQAEIDLMNEIKLKGAELEDLLIKAASHVQRQKDAAQTAQPGEPLTDAQHTELDRLFAAQPDKWIEISATHFQEGLMALTRAIAQPTFF